MYHAPSHIRTPLVRHVGWLPPPDVCPPEMAGVITEILKEREPLARAAYTTERLFRNLDELEAHEYKQYRKALAKHRREDPEGEREDVEPPEPPDFEPQRARITAEYEVAQQALDEWAVWARERLIEAADEILPVMKRMRAEAEARAKEAREVARRADSRAREAYALQRWTAACIGKEGLRWGQLWASEAKAAAVEPDDMRGRLEDFRRGHHGLPPRSHDGSTERDEE